MPNDEQGNNIKGQIVAGIITIVSTLIIGGSAPWWWQEIKPKSSQPEVTPPQLEEEFEPPEDPPISPRVPINIAYTGDYYACSLPISIAIGDQQFSPQGSLFQATGIQTGQQKYQINGQILCPTLGNCQVSKST